VSVGVVLAFFPSENDVSDREGISPSSTYLQVYGFSRTGFVVQFPHTPEHCHCSRDQWREVVLKFFVFSSVPLALFVMFAQVPVSAETYDLTNCGSSTVTTLSASPELTVLNFDTKGIARSNPANKAFDNATYHCVAVVSIAGAQQSGMHQPGGAATQRSGIGYCKFMETDGDFIVGEQTFDSTGGGKWKFLQGTGKWKGVTGGGEFAPLTNGKLSPGRGRVAARRTAPTKFPSSVRRILDCPQMPTYARRA
jgi:hypothetical protein